MFKRKDHDIFGTSTLGFCPRIYNASQVDPHTVFRQRTDDNYEQYSAKLRPTSHQLTNRPIDSTRVNYYANFQYTYHKQRKYHDMQSSIFYPPTSKPSIILSQQSYTNSPTKQSISHIIQCSYGRKYTLSREINYLPYNGNIMRGNQSRLFDIYQRVNHYPYAQQSMPLIPHQMKWDQHDSVRYAHINVKYEKKEGLLGLEESKSTVFLQEGPFEVNIGESNSMKEISLTKNIEEVNEEKTTKLKIKDTKKKGTIAPNNQNDPQNASVEIVIIRGWDASMLYGLSKYCKLTKTKLIKFEINADGKGVVILNRSYRWANVADWLRRYAKLKIKITNP